MPNHFDVIVIGAGPAGYVAAIRCAQLGLNTACVDKWRDAKNEPVVGGTCLNVGCIPSKALLESSALFTRVQTAAAHGIRISGAKVDLPAMMGHKNKIVAELTRGIATLFRANKITWIPGQATLKPNRQVELVAGGKTDLLNAEHVILATGSVPAEIKGIAVDNRFIVDSTGALSFDAVPARLGIIGAGFIGLELGSVWRRLGAEIVLLEAQDTFLAMADDQIAKQALSHFRAQGLNIHLGARVLGSAIKNDHVTVKYQDKNGDQQLQVDKLIMAVGRRPYTNGLCAPETELLLDEGGVIRVDEQCRTNLPGVFAIGDVVRGPMLAHKGSEEGSMVAELIAGHSAGVNYDVIPSVIYTHPEIAWVGKTEQALKRAGETYNAGMFPFSANGRAKALGETAGMIKILADANTDRVRGVHMIGPHCSELIAGAVLAMEFGATSEDMALTVFAHPSLAETLHEAAWATLGRPLHIARK